MQHKYLALLFVAASSMLCPAVAGAAAPVEVVRVTGPTVVAFFLPVTQKQLGADADLGETLGDFQFHLHSALPRLEQAGVQVHELYVTSFKVEMGGHSRVFHPVHSDVGYYFIRPGSNPRVEYDVMSNEDILEVAAQYFRKPDLLQVLKPGG